ncbi:MAG: CsgG/HfaB family protein [Elusimicrobiales bacterium]|nr:CsgG/HfaB family protein [Elusimicrobiales bacterium]
MKKLFFAAVLCSQAVFAAAGALDGKMDSIVKQFARDAAARNLAAPAAAVFPYSCDEALAKKRVDLAVSELLTARLQRDGAFRLVERAQLETVMKEQALGLSGALDSAAAAQVGKLAGARLSVLGTVARVGNSYQISSKLVDTESAEIISVSIVEVPLETFDAEAARYLVLVPEREALGLYLSFLYTPVKTKALPSVAIPDAPGGQVAVPEQVSGAFWGLGVGLRYQFARRWQGDLAVFPALTMGALAKFHITPAGSVSYQPYPGTLDGMGARLSFNRTARISGRWRAAYGLGYQIYGFNFYDSGTQSIYSGGIGSQRLLDKPSGGGSLYGAFAKGTLEFKLKERFAWSLTGQLNQPAAMTADWETPAGAKVRVMEVGLPPFLADTAFTFYF